MDRVLRERVGSASPRPSAGTCARLLPRLRLGRGLPGRPDAAALRGTLSGLGIDLDAQRQRPPRRRRASDQSPRAFCAPIEIPDKVMLVIQPQGGPDDWYALFHEAGHAEHFAFTDPNLKMEEKRLGDNAVTEGWAMLFDHLIDDRAWLSSMLELPAARRLRGRGRGAVLFYVAATARSCSTRSSSTRRRRDPDAQPLRRAPRRRAEGRAEPDGLSRRHRLRLLRDLVPARVGVLGPDDDLHARGVRHRLVQRAAKPARCSSSSGRSARSRTRTSC